MSLKWRIALWYASLLIVVLVVTSSIIAWRFQSILYDQAKASVATTMRAIVQSAQQPTLSSEGNSSGSLQFLFNSSNLAN
ncbi:MAG TPA: hypothetical protein VIJ77_03385, partial [Candidatus Tumulicola sp.]